MDGRELRELRRRRGFTQRQLADYLRISQQMVSKIERGERPLPSKPRPLYEGADEQQILEPSIREEIEYLLAADDDELRDLLGGSPRGPYGD